MTQDMPPPTTANNKDFAAIVGCKPSYVVALKRDGRLVLADDGKTILVPESLDRIEATRDPARSAVAKRHAALRGSHLGCDTGTQAPPSIPPEPPRADPAGEEDSPDYQQWRARRERAGALREEMRLAEEAKVLLRLEDVVTIVSNAFTTIRTDLEALPDSVAPVLAAEQDESRIRILLLEEIEQALGNLSTSIGQIGRQEE